MANDSRDLINRAAQLPHNDLILFWEDIVTMVGRRESCDETDDETDLLMFIYVGHKDHDEDANSCGDSCGRKPHWMMILMY